MRKRVIWIVLDSVGIGALPDAAKFQDEGVHTLKHIYEQNKKLDIAHLYSLGLAHIEGSGCPKPCAPPIGCYGRAAELTMAKDTISGHWEMAGLVMQTPFRTYPKGFPEKIIKLFEERTGRSILGNKVASGTEIIQELGDLHVRTGSPIVYTSADSVFQIAAHEDVIPLEELYRMCEIARGLLVGEDLVGRVIARPFVGKDGVYTRTGNRRDFAVEPPQDTILDGLYKHGIPVWTVGKISDVFCGRGIARAEHTHNNEEGINAALRLMQEMTDGLLFVNLVDFDMLYGHRNNVQGYAQALEYFDERLPEFLMALKADDVLIITADHGCDPTTPGTDHTREYIPIIFYGHALKNNINIGTRKSFADIGATVYEYLTDLCWPVGESFLSVIE